MSLRLRNTHIQNDGNPFLFPADKSFATVYKQYDQLGGAGSSGTIRGDKSADGETHQLLYGG